LSWTAPKTWVAELLTSVDLNAHVRDNLNFLKTNIALEEAEELTIADGVIEKTQSHHTVDTESDAASDDLISINGGGEGEILLIRPADGARTIVLKHGVSNIWIPGGIDITLDDASDYALLIFDGTNWCAIAGSGGGASAFTDLTDAPASYTDQGGKVVAVKSDASGLEFIVAAEGSGDFMADGSVPMTGDLDFAGNEAVNMHIEQLASEPDLAIGRIYQNTSDKKFYICKAD